MKKILIISGFSGVGKGTVIEQLMKLDSGIRLSVSETDRERRNATDRYCFITPEEFQENLKEGKYLEHNKYGNHHYGTPKQPVMDAMNNEESHAMILEIDVHGMRQVRQNTELKRMGVEIISVLLVVDAPILKERLVNRGDSNEEIDKRLKIGLEESQYGREYDHILVNDTVEATVNKLLAILQGHEIEEDDFDPEKFAENMVQIIANNGTGANRNSNPQKL